MDLSPRAALLGAQSGPTYARLYALFTLVGIAGEDDLDAPDLPAVGLSPGAQKNPVRPEQGATGLDPPAIDLKPVRPAQASNWLARAERSKPASLSADASENLRHQLIAELEQLVDPEALAAWAHRSLPLKNQLATADAQTVETAFAARLSQIEEAEPLLPSKNQKANTPGRNPLQTDPGDQAVVIRKPVRERDRDHLRFVALPAVSGLWKDPVRYRPHQVRGAAGDGTQGQRQVLRSDLQVAPP